MSPPQASMNAIRAMRSLRKVPPSMRRAMSSAMYTKAQRQEFPLRSWSASYDKQVVPANLSARSNNGTFLDAIFAESVPVEIPSASILASVGNTPIAEIEPGVFAKLEGYNFSGSIKDRAVLCTVLKMIETGELKDGSTLVLVTSGSAGLSLAMIQRALAKDCGINIRTLIMMPSAYESKAVPQEMIHEHGVKVFYNQHDDNEQCQLVFYDGVFMDVLANGKELARGSGYSVLDQHYDTNGMLAHSTTAKEIMMQMPDVTDVVVTTGTGATAAGLRAYLPETVTVHCRSSESGKIDGLSDVKRYDNFCNTELLEGYTGNSHFDADDAFRHQQELGEVGIQAGISSGAAFWLSREVKQSNPDAQICFISASGKACAPGEKLSSP